MSRMVEIRQGKLRGVEGTYADITGAFPTRNRRWALRFHAPEPPEPWEDLRGGYLLLYLPAVGAGAGAFMRRSLQ